MRILSYIEAEEHLETLLKKNNITLDDEARSIIISASGRLDEWIAPLLSAYKDARSINSTSAFHCLEQKGYFQNLFDFVPPDQRHYFLNPQLSGKDEWIRKNKFINAKNAVFSLLFTEWLRKQNLFDAVTKPGVLLTSAEERVIGIIFSHMPHVVSRDTVAAALWGERWLEKYSEYMIDTIIYRLRHKVMSPYKIVTLKNKGYLLSKSRDVIPPLQDLPVKNPEGISPHSEYLRYMNEPKNTRKTLIDLFSAVHKDGVDGALTPLLESPNPIQLLVINSFSFDNVDAAAEWIRTRNNTKDRIFFTNFNDAALTIHRKRVEELNLPNVIVIHDDIRKTRLSEGTFNLVINDFRLNFNSSHQQNAAAMRNMKAVLKQGGKALISVVVDPRYESDRYGIDQEKAPLNKYVPASFVFMEHLERFCFTVPYYKQLFEQTGFTIVREFDIEEGKTWYKKHAHIPRHEPSYRRFLLSV